MDGYALSPLTPAFGDQHAVVPSEGDSEATSGKPGLLGGWELLLRSMLGTVVHFPHRPV